MQEYLYHKNNQRVLEQQEREHHALKDLFKKKHEEDVSLRSSYTRRSSIDGEILPNVYNARVGYGSNT